MIEKVILKNFMPYRSVEIEPSGTTVAVVGENGQGKSAFLEAVPYAYYGISRASVISRMSRLKGDGSHAVEIQENSSEGLVKIRRGCKPSGTGFCTVHIGDTLVAKGKEANTWIENYLGMDADTYMLTAFFGLKDTRHDVLINVLPSTRLETFQNLAKIGPYKMFESRAKIRMVDAESEMERGIARIEGAKTGLADIESLREEVEDLQKQETRCLNEITELKENRKDLRVEEERYLALVKEKERLQSERKSTTRDISNTESDIENLTESIVEDSKTIDEEIDSKKVLVAKITGADLEVLQADEIDSRNKIAELKTLIDLKKTALGVDTDECPLCGAELLDTTVARWESDIASMEEASADYRSSMNKSLDAQKDYIRTNRQIEKYTESVKRRLESLKTDRARLAEAKRELKRLESEKAIKDERYLNLAEKLGEEYQGLQSDLEQLSDNITNLTGDLGVIRGSVKSIKDQIKRSEESRKAIAQTEREVKKARKEVEACKLLREAWNRYGIPLSLVHEVARDIEDRASVVYQEFDNGRIEVREVEDRGKPGIDFFLVDRKGERVYGQLSEGEKVMFYVAIRVAIAKIVSEGEVSIDYLIFDEAMGNLSPKNRDILVRLINKVLRKSFPQVFMVSHTEMRDIFVQTLAVTEVNGESRIKVV